MNNNLQDYLYKRYPTLFQDKDKSPQETLMCFGIEIGDGWYDIISSLCWMIDQYEEHIKRRKDKPEYFPVKFTQIKEKFGTLRVYFSGGDNYVAGLVDMAEELSGKTCEVCGNKGYSNKDGWISTLCEAHRNS